MYKQVLTGLGLIALVGCQSLPAPETKEPAKPAPSEKRKLKRLLVWSLPLMNAKKFSVKKCRWLFLSKKRTQQFDDGRKLPAFKKLMQQTQLAYKQGQWNQAEAAALQAQRLAPQSAETFLYLALVANKKISLQMRKL